MFEPTGDKPGELALFRGRLDLQEIELAECAPLKTYANAERGILAVVAGVGTANTAVSIMALGMSDALDLSNSLWMICGIAGGNPQVCSLGSVAISEWCVDGDLAFEIDAREIPVEWETGILPLGAQQPYGPSSLDEGLFGRPYQVFHLNGNLVTSVYDAVSKIELQDSAEMQAYRVQYTEYPTAQQSPRVLRGDTLSAARFWHGERSNDWAAKWVAYWTEDAACFATASMEDSGTLHAIEYLHSVGRADFQKVILLRGVSNFTLPPRGISAINNLVHEADGDAYYPGYFPALENTNRVAMQIIAEWVEQ